LIAYGLLAMILGLVSDWPHGVTEGISEKFDSSLLRDGGALITLGVAAFLASTWRYVRLARLAARLACVHGAASRLELMPSQSKTTKEYSSMRKSQPLCRLLSTRSQLLDNTLIFLGHALFDVAHVESARRGVSSDHD